MLLCTGKDDSQTNSDRIEAETPIRTTFLVDRELLPNCIAERTDIPLSRQVSEIDTVLPSREKLATDTELPTMAAPTPTFPTYTAIAKEKQSPCSYVNK